MSQVTIKINGYAYNIGCKDGEEAHLFSMAEQIEDRVNRAKSLGSQSGEAKLLVMAALFMADELHDLSAELRTRGGGGGGDAGPNERLREIAARAETIASSAEQG